MLEDIEVAAPPRAGRASSHLGFILHLFRTVRENP